MNTIKSIAKLNQKEMEKGITMDGSWHNDYRDSAYIFAGGLPYDMNEGDIAIVFSQFGEIVDVLLQRDKITGKSKGFAFVCYEDQRSTILAVDNFNNAEICGRIIRVDHVREFKPPREFLEIDEGDENYLDKIYKPSGPDGRSWGKWRQLTDDEKKAINIQLLIQKQDAAGNGQPMLQKTLAKKIIIDEDERVIKLNILQIRIKHQIIKRSMKIIYLQWEQLLMNKLDDNDDLLLLGGKQIKEKKDKKNKKDKKKDKKIKKDKNN